VANTAIATLAQRCPGSPRRRLLLNRLASRVDVTEARGS